MIFTLPSHQIIDQPEGGMVGKALMSIRIADGYGNFKPSHAKEILSLICIFKYQNKFSQRYLRAIRRFRMQNSCRGSNSNKFNFVWYFQDFSSFFMNMLKDKGLFYMIGK